MILSDSYPYTGNGLGGLPDAIEATVTHEVNGQYELFMRYPITGLHYEDLQNGYIIMAEPDDLTDPQPFRIYRITKPLNGIVSVYARHICYDAAGVVVEPFTADSLTTAIQTIPTKCTPASPITLSTTRTVASGMTLSEPRPLWKLLGGQAGSLLDVYGGEWDFDKTEAKLVTRLGTDRGVTIRYGKNLTSLEQDATIESSYSGVYPYWYDEESNTLVILPERFVPVTDSIVSDRLLVVDFSGDFEDAPTEQQLRDRASAYITANSVGNVKASWKVSFVDVHDFPFDQVMLGDTLHVYYEALDVNATARAVKTEYDVLAKRYKSITVGRVKQNLASIIVSQNAETQEAIKTTKSYLEGRVEESTDFIKHGAGYMRFIYVNDILREIVSLDDPDISQATNVWRWNNGGFGFSNTGYNGTYALALTQDGHIVADFIDTGTLTANVIRAGILQDILGKNSWNLDTGALTITDGSLNIETSSETDDAIRLRSANGSSNWLNWMSPSQNYLSLDDGTGLFVGSQYASYLHFQYMEGADRDELKRELYADAYGLQVKSIDWQSQHWNTRINQDGFQIARLDSDWNETSFAMWLEQSGLHFYDSNGDEKTFYDPAYQEEGGTMSVGTGWTLCKTLYLTAGLWIVNAGLAYYNSAPRGVAIVGKASGSSTDYNLAVNESYASITGSTVSWLWCGTPVRITGSTTWQVMMYGKSATAATNRVYMSAMRIA